MSTMPDSYVIVLPDEWDEIPLEPQKYMRFVARQAETFRRNDSLRRADIRQYELLAVCVHHLMARWRTIMASSFVSIENSSVDDRSSASDQAPGSVETNSDRERSTVLSATCAMSILLREELNSVVPLTSDLIVRALSSGSLNDPVDDGSAIKSTNIEAPSICEIGVHSAVRLLRLMTVKTSATDAAKLFSQSYMVPVAQGDAAVLLQMSTPNFEHARQFSELFTTIAESLRVKYPENSTFGESADEDEPETA